MNENTYFGLCTFGCKPYTPKINRKRQAGLFSLMLGDVIIPMTFGVGFWITKLITKYSPLYLYK